MTASLGSSGSSSRGGVCASEPASMSAREDGEPFAAGTAVRAPPRSLRSESERAEARHLSVVGVRAALVVDAVLAHRHGGRVSRSSTGGCHQRQSARSDEVPTRCESRRPPGTGTGAWLGHRPCRAGVRLDACGSAVRRRRCRHGPGEPAERFSVDIGPPSALLSGETRPLRGKVRRIRSCPSDGLRFVGRRIGCRAGVGAQNRSIVPAQSGCAPWDSNPEPAD
jgi:hypothetical protein